MSLVLGLTLVGTYFLFIFHPTEDLKACSEDLSIFFDVVVMRTCRQYIFFIQFHPNEDLHVLATIVARACQYFF